MKVPEGYVVVERAWVERLRETARYVDVCADIDQLGHDALVESGKLIRPGDLTRPIDRQLEVGTDERDEG